ncbi:hypothetical protein [uncultured Duncaniella sp.]|uniref:hypothetical protein n=1 Tax=uncultured Duncaniella sp. TaxID=2768039 RepID=UPI00272FA4E6|nr:hypothetical protein [uncultured Duncaniella sp.]
MIYKECFINSEFEDVWHTLQTCYDEPESVRNLYKTLFYTIRNMPVDDTRSAKPVKIVRDFEGMIHVAGAPDPIEWLVGREVIFDNTEMPAVAELAAHMLYWSTLYDFKTQTRYHKDCQCHFEEGIAYNYVENPEKDLSLKRKACHYWKDTVANDSAIDWSYILDILRKRIEYHIGYHRFTDRFVNSKHYVSRMELCCRLLELAASDSYDIKGIYVNTRNASRYIGRIFSQYDYDKIGKGDEFNELRLSELRRAKAYWQFLDHNLTYWWD